MGWDGLTWEMEYQKVSKFFAEKGLGKDFGNLDNLLSPDGPAMVARKLFANFINY